MNCQFISLITINQPLLTITEPSFNQSITTFNHRLSIINHQLSIHWPWDNHQTTMITIYSLLINHINSPSIHHPCTIHPPFLAPQTSRQPRRVAPALASTQRPTPPWPPEKWKPRDVELALVIHHCEWMVNQCLTNSELTTGWWIHG